MPSIIPPISRPTIQRNVTEGIQLQSVDYVVATGTTLFSDGLSASMFIDYGFGKFSTFSNSGIVWTSGIGATVLRAHNFERLDNAGILVAEATAGQAFTVSIESTFRQGLHNSGSIYAIATGGAAYTVQDWSTGIFANSGLIAAKSDISAVAIYRHNGGTVANSETGRILAESPGATGLIFIGAPRAAPGMEDPPTLFNAGLIEAVSTDAGQASTAILVTTLASQLFRLENSGTIRADFAIYSSTSWFSPVQASPQSITNLSGGLIEGIIWLGLGDDVIVNTGVIRGDVSMGDGNDLFDNAAGVFEGAAYMDWGNDRFLGGSRSDFASGDRGADSLFGGAGHDLLIGGRGDDFLQGDDGNDGLYGDYGNDHILTRDGDRADGGAGDDRIEIGDYSFHGVFGGSGMDTLVLAMGPRAIDLQQMLATGRVGGFELIELSGEKLLVIREGDIAAMTGGGTRLIVAGDASDTLDLIGGWTADGEQTIGSTIYRVYSSGGSQLLVAGQTVVAVTSNAPAGSSGLDAVHSGPAPFAPGDDTGIYLSPSRTVVDRYTLNGDLTIGSDEVWTTPDGPDLHVAFTGGTHLTNLGAIISNGFGITGRFLSVRNEGFVGVSSLTGTDKLGQNTASFNTYGIHRATDNISAIAINVDLGGPGTSIVNTGEIEVETDQVTAVGLNSYLLSRFENSGSMEISSTHFIAVGVFAHNGGDLVNSGTITATGAIGAYGIGIATHVADIRNSGTITAQASAPGASAIGVYFYYQSGTNRLENSGTITADIAIQTSWNVNGGALRLVNSGEINGRIELNINPNGGPANADVIINTGSINGSVYLGGNNDLYDGRGGRQTGTIYGEAGRDILIGTGGADRIDGGSDDDILFADGADTLTGGSGRDTFVFSHVTGDVAQITDFVSGVDRINLAAIEPVSVTLARSGGTTRITAVTSSGTLVINATGQVVDSDIERFGPLNGTTESDVMAAAGSGAALLGGEGDDFLFGFGGADTLDGGTGIDFMAGGAGDDTYVVDTLNDVIFERNGEGFDTVRLSGISTFAIPDNIERLIGGDENNFLTGSARNDVLDGGNGRDTVYLSGAQSDYRMTRSGDGYTLVDQRAGSPEGTDTLYNIEFLIFDGGQPVSMAYMLDSTPPTIVTTGPADGAVNVDTTSNIVVTFSEQIMRGEGTIELRLSDGTLIDTFHAGTSDRITVAGSVLTIDPVHTLNAGTHYVVVMNPGTVRDLTGNAFAGSASYDFTTRANPSNPAGAGRFIASDGLIASIGPDGQVFGTRGFQDLTIIDQPGALTLDGSFGGGGDVIRLAGAAANYTARIMGSFAILSDGDSQISIPVGLAGTSLVFGDGLRTLVFADGAVKIGSQSIDATAATLSAPSEVGPIPTGGDPGASGWLVMNPGGVAAIAGNFQVYGTRNGHEVLEIQGGKAMLDSSFGGGGDTVILNGLADGFTARIAGSFVILHSDRIDASIPIGTAGLTLRFTDGDRTLIFDAGSSTVRIGTQSIGSDATGLSPTHGLSISGAGSDEATALENQHSAVMSLPDHAFA